MRSALVLAGAATFIVSIAPILAGWYYHGLDLTRVDLGLLCAVQDQLQRGESLWLSRYLGGGGPLFARPDTLLLYPPRWPAFLMPPDLGAAWGVVFHLTAAAVATTYLCSTFPVRPSIAAIAGGCFVLSGTVLDLILHANYIVAAAWVPLAWAATRAYLRCRGRRFHLLTVGTSLALLLLGGEPQAFGIATALCAYESGAALIRHGRARLRKVALGVATVGAAFLLGMSQWLATLAEMRLTPRGASLSADQIFAWPFEPLTWAAVLWPGFLTEPARPYTHLWAIFQGAMGPSFPWNRQPYLGPLFVGCLVAGMFSPRARRAAVVVLAALLLALGDRTPVLPLAAKLLPGISLFRYPAKYLVVMTLAAVVVVGVFLTRLARDRAARRQLGVAALTLVTFEGGVWCWLRAHADLLDRTAAAVPAGVDIATLPPLSTLVESMLVQSATPLVLALALLAMPRAARLRPHVGLLILADLAVAAPAALFIGPSLADLTSPFASNLENPVLCVDPKVRGRAFQNDAVYSRWGDLVVLRALPDSETSACDHVVTAVPYSALTSSMAQHLERGLSHRRAAAARALGCTHFLSERPPIEGTTTPLPSTAPWVEGYEALTRARLNGVDDPLPPQFSVHHPTVVHGDLKLVRALSATRDAAAAARIVDDPLAHLPEGSALPEGAAVTGVEVVRTAADAITLTASGSGGGVLGVRSAFLVGWRAFQGDAELPTVRIAGTHLGVVVADVGRGAVTLRYRPPRLFAAGALGLVGLGLLIALSVVGRRS